MAGAAFCRGVFACCFAGGSRSREAWGAPRPPRPRQAAHVGSPPPGTNAQCTAPRCALSPQAARDEALEGLDPYTYFTRFAFDHHSFVFGSKQVREITRPGANAHNRVDDMGQMSWQVDTLAETVNATPWLADQGLTITHVGRDMPGSN